MKIILALSLFVNSLILQAQCLEGFLSFKKRVVYELNYVPDSSKKSEKVYEYRDLYIGDDCSLFTFGYKDKTALPFIIDKFNHLDFFILKDRKETAIFSYSNLFLGRVGWKDKKARMNWILEDSLKIIGDYLCKKATTNFRGRTWTAWYTEEITISDGPYKFQGLSGLIIYLIDSKKEYEFVFDKMEDMDAKALKLDLSKTIIYNNPFDYYRALDDGGRTKHSNEPPTIIKTKSASGEEVIEELKPISLLPKNLIELTDENGKRIVLK